MIPRLLPAAALALVALAAPPASAPATAQASVDGIPFEAYLELLKARARAEGVREDTLERMTAGLTPNPRVIALDNNQPGSATTRGYRPMSHYIRTHVDAARIAGGRAVYVQNQSTLAAIEARYGVPAPILVAIFGHETGYGKVKGDFDLARSLATFAWEGRRRELFAGEFVALMKIADKGYPREQLVGSYAGAFGNPQFLPSVYLRLATDGDGDGRADIFANRADTFASIANYFRDAGWRPNEPWGVPAAVPPGFEVSAYRTRLVSPVCPRVHERLSRWMTVAEWRAVGVEPLRPLGENVMTAFFQPDGPGTRAWLLTGNYRAILEYNCSSYYALSVGLLADEIVN